MSSSTLIPVSEYLGTIYRPDRHYIDGHLVERNLGKREHAALQGILTSIFHNNRRAWGVIGLPEQRVKVTKSNYRVTDLCVVRSSDPRDPIVTHPPLLAVEILSDGDTLKKTYEEGHDYLGMGVEHFWIFDPIAHKAFVGTATTLAEPENGELSIPNTQIRLVLKDIFAELDELL
jgi:Uma2 family endonuclease